MPNDAVRLYVYCVGFEEDEIEKLYKLVEDYGFPIYDSYEGLEGEITYLTQAFASNDENIEIVDELEVELREQYPESDVDRDEKNVSHQAPGIDGVSYVTGITINQTS